MSSPAPASAINFNRCGLALVAIEPMLSALLRLDELPELLRVSAGVGMVLPRLHPERALHICT